MLLAPDKAAFLDLLHSRQVFAYPTEAVYGLGGDPQDADTFAQILRLKGGRRPGQGMLLVAADWAQCHDWVAGLDAALIARLEQEAADRATTFILPATDNVPAWLRDEATGRIAIRVSRHPLVCQLCAYLHLRQPQRCATGAQRGGSATLRPRPADHSGRTRR